MSALEINKLLIFLELMSKDYPFGNVSQGKPKMKKLSIENSL